MKIINTTYYITINNYGNYTACRFPCVAPLGVNVWCFGDSFARGGKEMEELFGPDDLDAAPATAASADKESTWIGT